MSTNIGSPITGLTNFNVNTLMPDLSDTANIQEALRLYHYGAPSGTGIGQYDPTNTNPANLVNPSIAHSLYNLQTQISSISGNLGVQASTWSAKGVLVSATAASSVAALTVGTNGQVLTANSATSTGLQWATPSVTDVNTVTLLNKTLTAPKITASSFIADTNGNAVIALPALVSTPVNYLTISNTATTVAPTITATGTDTNIGINFVPKGTGIVQINGTEISTISGTQTLTNKTLTTPIVNAPTITQLYLSDSVIVFEGSTADAFETTLTVADPTADRTITLPNINGTVITTGNLSDITSVGTITSGSFPVANLTGTTLPSNIVSSSLTSVGTITSGSFPAANLTGTTLSSNVVTSSLTTVGTLGSLTVTNNASIGGTLTVTGNVIGHLPINTQSAGYQLVLSDDGKMIEAGSSSTIQITIPLSTSVNFPVGTQINILQTGTGQVTVGVTAGVTLNCTPQGIANTAKLRAQWSTLTLIKRGTDLWVATGDLIA